MKFTQNDRVIVLRVFRQALYFILMMAFIFLMYGLAGIYHEKTFAEHGIVENIQFALLGAATLSFFIQACLKKEYQYTLLLLSSAALMACFRESDKFFDHLPYLCWEIGFIFPFWTFYLCLRHWKKTKKSLMRFFSSPAFNMMVCAMIIVIPVAQCIGHGPFIRNVLGVQNISSIKEMFEEASEAIGYLLIFLSSLECIWSMPKK